MDLIALGKITKPHGYKGEFVAAINTGNDSVLKQVKTVFVGPSPTECKAYPVLHSTWMPRGWKIKLEGIDSDEDVKKLRGFLLFVERQSLPPPEEGEYYIADLIGATVMDADTERQIGKFAGVEDSHERLSGSQDRWWIDVGGELLPVPATKRYIHKVDIATRTLWLKNLGDLK